MIVDKINKYLSENELVLDEKLYYDIQKLSGWSFKRQFMENSERDLKGKIYLSSVGRCARQVAYGFHGFEKKGKEQDGRSKITFWMGDNVETVVTGLAKISGVNIIATGLEQMTIKFQVNGTHITGHPDGIVFEEKEHYLFECKSMSDYGYEKFERGEIDDSYLAQINAYMEALGITKCVMVAINKNNGCIAEHIVEKDDAIVKKIRKNILAVMHSTQGNLPERAYKPDAKGFYPWQCMYCPFYVTCLIDCGAAEKILVKNAYKLKEIKKEGKDVTGLQPTTKQVDGTQNKAGK